jgi:hypothetical protein
MMRLPFALAGILAATLPGTASAWSHSGAYGTASGGGGSYYSCSGTWFSASFGANGVYYRVVPAPSS